MSRFNMSKKMNFFLTIEQKNVAVIERLGKFHTILDSGLQFKIPIIDQVAYTHTLKEEVHDIPNQHAITKDNVKVKIATVLYYKVIDA